MVNASLLAIWALSGGGFFWPVLSILFWGIGLLFDGWNPYYERKPISEAEIRREMGDQG